jgi:hypothetical protein
VAFIGIFISLLGTVGMLKGQVNFRYNDKGEPEVKIEDDPKIRYRERKMYRYGIWLLLIGFIVQLLSLLI